MKLAERRVVLSEKFHLGEIRKLNENGHQTSILSSNYKVSHGEIAGAMFKRWSQENFFKYMLKNFGIDRRIEYETEPIDETVRVVNPEYRELESKSKKLNSKRARLLVQYGAIKLEAIDDPQMVKKYETKMAQLREEITTHETGIRQLKEQRKKIKKHSTFAQLPHDKKFNKLVSEKNRRSQEV